tara:strand:- start:68 stop:1402 length:1335 start_codon:yes stop_codon:yes gene_type:complete
VIDMAEAEKTKEKTKKDEVTGDTLVWSEAERKYVNKTMSPELYKQQKAAQRKQAGTAAAAGLVAEGLQFGIGASVFGDPAIKAAGQEKARLAAELRKGPDYLTDAEKQARREAGLAPVQRKAEAVQRRAEKVAASTGDVSVRSLLAAGETGIAQIRQQALETEAGIAKEDLTRQQLKEQQDEKTRQGIEETDAMMLELRNKYIREPLHKFVASAGKAAGLMMAHAPARSIDDQIAELRKQGVSEEEIAKFTKLARRRGQRRTEKLFDEALGTSPAAVEAKNKKLEMEALELADKAVAGTRGERGEATGEKADKPVDTGLDKTKEEIKAELKSTESEFDRQVRERKEAEDLKARRISRTGAYTGSDMDPRVHGLPVAQSFDKEDYTYVYDLRKKVWTVYKDDKKLDFEVSIDKAKASDDPNVRELYDLALVNDLLLEEELSEGMA